NRALAWVERAKRVAGPAHAALIARVEEQAVSQAVARALQQEGLEAALARAREAGLPVDGMPFPWGRRLRVLVRTEPDRRTITAEWVSPLLPGIVAAQVEGLAAHMGARVPSGIAVTHSAEESVVRLVIEIVGPPETWPDMMAAVAALLPEDENVDVVRSVLRPTALTWAVDRGWLEEWVMYRERVALQSRAVVRAEAIRQQASGSRWERLLLDEAANLWEHLASGQDVVYEIRVESGGRVRRSTWRVRPPAAEELVFTQTWLRADRIAWLVAGGVGVLLAMLTLIWRWPMRTG
ncbi:MAG: hypothetical protein Q9O62_02390, partial [Ardenticatenia bacterium]|nr:hypothetical protein [Ardenticatenia bacterium]